MKIIIAADSYKGNLTSLEVANAIETGIVRTVADARCVKIPVADGGEGTVQALVDGLGGEFYYQKVQDPLGRPVRARYGLLPDNTAVIEMAEASGLPLLTSAEQNPLETSSYGTGELILAALEKGAERILIGLGGSATNDGGVGMAQALGILFLDKQGQLLTENGTGGRLKHITAVDMAGLHPAVLATPITIACDVSNPLCGKEGASVVFGPQKGASPEMVKQLDQNLQHLAKLIQQQFNLDIETLPGGGAAGGMGAGLVAFTGAHIANGFDTLASLTQLGERIAGADLVITGEGCVDFQTAFGKAPGGVARLARSLNVPVIAIGGGLADDANELLSENFDGLVSACARTMPLQEAMALSTKHLANAAERMMRLLLIGGRICSAELKPAATP